MNDRKMTWDEVVNQNSKLKTKIREREFLLKRAMNCPKNKPALCDDCRDKILKALEEK